MESLKLGVLGQHSGGHQQLGSHQTSNDSAIGCVGNHPSQTLVSQVSQASLAAQALAETYHQTIHFPKASKSEFITYTTGVGGVGGGGNANAIEMSSNSNANNLTPDQTLFLGGDKGYRTALCSHGFTEGCYYFEVEMLAPALPLPFPGVQPALRIGFACEDQDLELPLGTHPRSYAYSSSGKLVNSSKSNSSRTNQPFCKCLLFLILVRDWRCSWRFDPLEASKTSFPLEETKVRKSIIQ